MTKLEMLLIAAVLLLLAGAGGGWWWEHKQMVALENKVAVAEQSAKDAAKEQKALDDQATKDVNDEAEKSLAAFGQHTADVLVQLHSAQARSALLAAASAKPVDVKPLGQPASTGTPIAEPVVPGVCAPDPLTGALGYELKDALTEILLWRDYARRTGQAK